VLYPEKDFKPAFTSSEVRNKDYNPEAPYFCSAMINVVRRAIVRSGKGDEREKFVQANLTSLLQAGGKFSVQDSDGLDVMMHAIKNNNFNLVDFLITNKQMGELNVDA